MLLIFTLIALNLKALPLKAFRADLDESAFYLAIISTTLLLVFCKFLPSIVLLISPGCDVKYIALTYYVLQDIGKLGVILLSFYSGFMFFFVYLFGSLEVVNIIIEKVFVTAGRVGNFMGCQNPNSQAVSAPPLT